MPAFDIFAGPADAQLTASANQWYTTAPGCNFTAPPSGAARWRTGEGTGGPGCAVAPIGAIATIENSFSSGEIFLDNDIVTPYTIGTLPYSGFVILGPPSGGLGSVTCLTGLSGTASPSSGVADFEVTWGLFPLIASATFSGATLNNGIGTGRIPGPFSSSAPPPNLYQILGILTYSATITRVAYNNDVFFFTTRYVNGPFGGFPAGLRLSGTYSLWSTQITFDGAMGCPGDEITVRDGASGMNQLSTFYLNYFDGSGNHQAVLMPVVSRDAGYATLTIPSGPSNNQEVSISAVFTGVAPPPYTGLTVVLGGFTMPATCGFIEVIGQRGGVNVGGNTGFRTSGILTVLGQRGGIDVGGEDLAVHLASSLIGQRGGVRVGVAEGGSIVTPAVTVLGQRGGVRLNGTGNPAECSDGWSDPSALPYVPLPADVEVNPQSGVCADDRLTPGDLPYAPVPAPIEPSPQLGVCDDGFGTPRGDGKPYLPLNEE